VYVGPSRIGVFLVKDIEGAEADVPDFFLTEGEFMSRCDLHLWQIRRRSRRRAARERQQSSGSQYRYGFRPTLSLQALLRARHGV
jgi:hypothetical protein